jgi:hypothetical protein
VKRAAAFLATNMIAIGVRLAQWAEDFVQEDAPEEDAPDDPRMYPVEFDEEALRMVEEGKRRPPTRENVPDEPPLEGSLRSRRRARTAP